MPERALDCLRRLVIELCTAGQLEVLCALPFAGALTVRDSATGVSHVVPMMQEVVETLERRAVNGDVYAKPQPYRCAWGWVV